MREPERVVWEAMVGRDRLKRTVKERLRVREGLYERNHSSSRGYGKNYEGGENIACICNEVSATKEI